MARCKSTLANSSRLTTPLPSASAAANCLSAAARSSLKVDRRPLFRVRQRMVANVAAHTAKVVLLSRIAFSMQGCVGIFYAWDLVFCRLRAREAGALAVCCANRCALAGVPGAR